MSIHVRVSDPGLARFMAGPGLRYMLRLGNRVLNNSRGRVNVDTGLLRSTGTVEEVGGIDAKVRVAYRTRYARYVHDGTRHYRGNPYLTDAMKEEIRR